MRFVLWALNIATFVITISVLSYFIALTGSMPPRPPGFLIFLLFLPYYVVLPGIVYVIVGALRSKDPTPRKNLIWFGLFMAALIPSFLLPTGDIITSLLFDVAIFLSAYFLFRSARSLAPINRFSKEIVSKGSGM